VGDVVKTVRPAGIDLPPLHSSLCKVQNHKDCSHEKPRIYEPHLPTNLDVMGPSLQVVNIGATGATLQIVDGGMRLPDTLDNKN
jgi:hypothetical protein